MSKPTMSGGYRIPAESIQSELVVRRSRFLSKIQMTSTVPEARAAIAEARKALPDASHHVYAFKVGFGNSVNEGMSDDGEPSGTAGPPTLAVLRGSGIGDITIVTARYFGGVKLGAGGLVRAYTLSAQEALRRLKTELKLEKKTVGLEMSYSQYNVVKRLITAHGGTVDDEVFDAQILIVATFAVSNLDRFAATVQERTAGAVQPVDLS
ncbi:MAG: YigZ family protein [Chloroflexota bacterium]|nr:YigZ family protein [Chloroflexota bacterium]